MLYKYCQNRCCYVKMVPFHKKITYKKNTKKGGIVLHNTETNEILLVCSRGLKWGPPKGGMETSDTTIFDCALRELYEETGIDLSLYNYEIERRVRMGRATYFYIPIVRNPSISIKTCTDASGIGWVRLGCLKNIDLDLNSPCKKLLDILFDIRQS